MKKIMSSIKQKLSGDHGDGFSWFLKLPRKTNVHVVVAVLLTLLLTLTSYNAAAQENQNELLGIPHAQYLLNNISFDDLENHWAQKSINEVAALSIMRGRNNNTFDPNATLTRQEVLTTLVRLIGQEQEAQQFGSEQAPNTVRGIKIFSTLDNWAKGYVQLAIQNGIVTNEEVDEILNLTDAQTEEINNIIENAIERYEDEEFTGAEVNQMEQQIREKMELDTAWNKPVTREQTAIWISRVLELEPIYAENIVKLYNFNDWKQLKIGNVPTIEAILQDNIMNGVSESKFDPKGNLTRAQLAQLIYNINDRLLEERQLTTGFAVITTTERKPWGRLLWFLNKNLPNKTTRPVPVVEADGEAPVPEVGAAWSTTTNENSDFIVLKNGELGLSNLLSEGDKIKYYLNENNEIIYARVIHIVKTQAEGFIKLIDTENNRIEITDFNENELAFEISDLVSTTINKLPATLKDLPFGLEVVVELENGIASKIMGIDEIDPERHGYIPPRSKVKVGTVLFIDKNSIEIEVNENRERYRMTPTTAITRNEKIANLFEIKIGDRVKLEFDDIYSADIANIRVADDEKHIQAIYSATLESVLERSNEIILNNIEIYENGMWVNHPEQKLKIKITDQIFRENAKIEIQELDKLLGSELIMAVQNGFGIKTAEKTLVQQGSKQLFDSKIQNIHFGTNKLIASNTSFEFNQGTIIVKNNRLVDALNLGENQTVSITANWENGDRNLAFVSIKSAGMLDERIDGTQLVIYKGKIINIYDYKVEIARFALEKTMGTAFVVFNQESTHRPRGQWVEIIKTKDFNLTEDTIIFDSELESKIATKHFTGARFINPEEIKNTILRQRVQNQHYLNRLSYFVVKKSTLEDGQIVKEALGINLAPNLELFQNNITKEYTLLGQVQSIDIDNKELTLKNPRTWNNLTNRWDTISTQAVKINRAIIFINDKPITHNQLYLIKENATAQIVVRKDVSNREEGYILIITQ